MLQDRRHESGANPQSAVLWHDEDALDVCGKPTCRPMPWNPREKCDPGHPNDLGAEKSSDERHVGVLVGAPPLREIISEGVHGRP
jgi:hypothetical protein